MEKRTIAFRASTRALCWARVRAAVFIVLYHRPRLGDSSPSAILPARLNSNSAIWPPNRRHMLNGRRRMLRFVCEKQKGQRKIACPVWEDEHLIDIVIKKYSNVNRCALQCNVQMYQRRKTDDCGRTRRLCPYLRTVFLVQNFIRNLVINLLWEK